MENIIKKVSKTEIINNNGIYIEEFLRRDIQRNLLYTGITRFKDRITYVKERRKYF